VDAQARYEEIADDLVAQNPDVELTKMMGMPSIKRGAKLVAGFYAAEGAMVFKLTDPEVHGEAMALGGAHLFDPSGRGRPMREWVVVPAVHEELWPELAQRALTPSG
jgi:hypothetical protein